MVVVGVTAIFFGLIDPTTYSLFRNPEHIMKGNAAITIQRVRRGFLDRKKVFGYFKFDQPIVGSVHDV